MAPERRFMESDGAARLISDLRADLIEPGTTLPPEAPISQVIEALLAHPQSRAAYVVDANGKLLGAISWRSVLKAAKARMGVQDEGTFSVVRLFRDLRLETARDIMRSPTAVFMEETLRDALLKMEKFHENDLPVVDPEGRFLGEVNGMRMMQVALETFRSTEAALEEARGH